MVSLMICKNRGLMNRIPCSVFASSILLSLFGGHVPAAFGAPKSGMTKADTHKELPATSEDFRARQPEPGKIHEFKMPMLNTFVLGNGLKVFLLEDHRLPTISLDLSFPGGRSQAAKPILAPLCMELATSGTKRLSIIQWNEQLADRAAKIRGLATDETESIVASSLTGHFKDTVALLAETLTSPGLRPSEFDRILKSALASLKQDRSDPKSISERISQSIIYGPDHPLGKIPTEDDLKKITVSDCEQHLARVIHPDGAQLFITGDITKGQVSDLFGAIPGFKGKVPKIATMPPAHPREGKIFFVNVPGAEQSAVGIRDIGPIRSAPDFFATTLMSRIFGGGFSGRINMNLREDKGYSYGARGGFAYHRQSGDFAADTTVRSDATYQTIIELVDEITALQTGTKPATAEELAREKNGAILGLPGTFATSQSSLSNFKSLVFYSLPMDFYNHYNKDIEQVTLKDIQKAAAAHLDFKRGKLIVVGDGAKPVIYREGKEDKPLLKDGKPVTLLESLKDLLIKQKVSGKTLTVLDADGKEVEKLNLGS